MTKKPTPAAALTPADLVYARAQRCRCGAGLAIIPGRAEWRCSALLLRPPPESLPALAAVIRQAQADADDHDPIYPMHNHPYPSEKQAQGVTQDDGSVRDVFSTTRPA